MINTAAAGFFLLFGSGVLLIGAIGLLRMPDFFTRLHAASVIDTLGTISILLGLLLQADIMNGVKLLLILFFILFTSPIATHALAKTAMRNQSRPYIHS